MSAAPCSWHCARNRHSAAERAGRTEEAGRGPGRQQRHPRRLQLIVIGFLYRAQHQPHLSVSTSFHIRAQTASTSTKTSILAARPVQQGLDLCRYGWGFQLRAHGLQEVACMGGGGGACGLPVGAPLHGLAGLLTCVQPNQSFMSLSLCWSELSALAAAAYRLQLHEFNLRRQRRSEPTGVTQPSENACRCGFLQLT